MKRWPIVKKITIYIRYVEIYSNPWNLFNFNFQFNEIIIPESYNKRQGTWNQETNPKNYAEDSEKIMPLRNNTYPTGSYDE